MRDNPDKICPHLHISMQSGSDAVLKAMNRPTSSAEYLRRCRLANEYVPDVALTTDVIVGFPGETEKDHKILASFVRRMKFDRLGVFAYSREEGTPAAKMASQIPAPVKRKRRSELMLLQQEIAFRKARRMKGKTVEAIIEGRIVGEDVYTARTYMDAPGVDGTLFIETRRELMSGDFVNVKITGSDQYDLVGVIAD